MTNEQRQLMQHWIEALRSGKYQQGLGCLKEYKRVGEEQVPHYCCLGVLCEVAAQHRPELDVSWVDDDYENTTTKRVRVAMTSDGDRNESYPPKVIMDEVGIDYDFSRQLADMNDSYKYDFKIIAAILEQYMNSTMMRDRLPYRLP